MTGSIVTMTNRQYWTRWTIWTLTALSAAALMQWLVVTRPIVSAIEGCR